jgi:hypothetical protein
MASSLRQPVRDRIRVSLAAKVLLHNELLTQQVR